MQRIKAGIIGTGFIGPAHVEALRRLGFVEVAAVAERGDDLAKAKAEQMSIPKAYGDYRKMLADPEIQVVHNCTPNHLHFGINKEILAAKKHIISEKPLAMTSAESRELVRLAKDAGVVNAINFNYRYMPLVQHARQMCQAAGDVGRIYAVHGSYLQDWLLLANDWNWRLVPELSGDSRAVADVGSHWCDLVQFITGMKIVRVMADLVTIHPVRKRPKVEVETYAGKVLRPEDLEDVKIGTEDYGSILLEFDSGAHGSLTVNQCAAGRKNRLYLEIDGEKCAVSWNQERPNELWVGRRDGPNQSVMKDPSLLHPDAREYAHYPGGHNEIAICEAALKSSRERRWVDVEY
jgi:predicted dehydrogenase